MKKLFLFLKRLFHKKRIEPIVQTDRIQLKPASTETFPKSHVKIRNFIISQRNLERKKQSRHKYAKFFKHRQPTTSRKLWKPNAKLEEE